MTPSIRTVFIAALLSIAGCSPTGSTPENVSSTPAQGAPPDAAAQKRIAELNAYTEKAVEDGARTEEQRHADIAKSKIMAVVGAKQLKDSMREPESFRLARVVSGGDSVCYVYRARNGFGGMNIERAILIVSTGEMLTGDRVQANWNGMCSNEAGENMAAAISEQLAQIGN
jgi:hypothetical protein